MCIPGVRCTVAEHKLTLRGMRVLAGVTMARQLKSAWISQVDPISRGRCPSERQRKTRIQRRSPWAHGGRGRSESHQEPTARPGRCSREPLWRHSLRTRDLAHLTYLQGTRRNAWPGKEEPKGQDQVPSFSATHRVTIYYRLHRKPVCSSMSPLPAFPVVEQDLKSQETHTIQHGRSSHCYRELWACRECPLTQHQQCTDTKGRIC